MFENLKLRGGALVTGAVSKVAAWVVILAMLVTTVFTAPLFGIPAYAGMTGDDAGLAALAEGEITALANAAAPDIGKQPLAKQTYSKVDTASVWPLAERAKVRMYVKASSTDGGYLTYQWYRSEKFDALLATEPNGQPNAASIATITADKEGKKIAAPAGTKSTLETLTPEVAGYYYYWVEVTNNNDANSNGIIEAGESALLTSDFVTAKIVNRVLPDHIINGDFTYWAGYPAGSDDNGPYAAKAGAQINPNGNTSLGKVAWYETYNYNNETYPALAFMAHPANTDPQAGWYSTHSFQGMGTSVYAGVLGSGWSTYKSGMPTTATSFATPSDGQDWPYPVFELWTGHANTSYREPAVELGNTRPSGLYQDIATAPGKIYEWSFDHQATESTGANATQKVALIMGKSINESNDYPAGKNRWEKNSQGLPISSSSAWTNLMPLIGVNYEQTYKTGYTYTDGDFRYGTSEQSFFDDIINTLAGSYANRPNLAAGSYTVSYNGSTYYIHISSVTAITSNNTSEITHNSGTYTVPEGQGTTVFGFASVSPLNVGSGNVLKKISFASGSKIGENTNDNISYSGDTKISTTTQSNFAYTLAEVRGSSVSPILGLTANYNGGNASSYINGSLGDGNWYTGFANSGTLEFTNLTPGKTYRVIGIPVNAISVGLGTNLSAADVLDDGYYQDIALSGATTQDPADLPSAQISYYNGGTQARIELQNTNTSVQYALLSESGDAPNTTTPKVAWTAGNSGALLFDGLSPNTNYYLVARPLGYSEVNYATAPRLKINIPVYNTGAGKDLTATQVSRDSSTGQTISVASSEDGYTYAIYDPDYGDILQTVEVTSNGQAVSFTGLNAAKTYQVIQRYTSGGNYLQGVRVYPYPTQLAATNALKVDFSARTVTSAAGGAVSGALEYGIVHDPYPLPDAVSYTAATGTSTISLAGQIAADGKVIYRVAKSGGYTGASVQPAEEVGYTAIPATPLFTTNYTIDYAAETVGIVNGTAVDYDWYDSSGNSALAGPFSGSSATFASLGWTGSAQKFYLRVAATANTFASEFAEVNLIARAPAPELSASLDTLNNLLTIGGLLSENWYEYKQTTQNWSAATSVNGASVSYVEVPYTAGSSSDFDYQVRIKAVAASAPASYEAVIASPLFIAPTNFGSKTYGEAVTSLQSAVTISNIATGTLNIMAIRLTGADATSFVIDSSSGTAGVTSGTPNSSYKVGPSGTLNARSTPYTATVEVEYYTTPDATSGATAVTSTNVSMTVTKATWVISGATFTPTATSDTVTVAYSGLPTAPTAAPDTTFANPILSWNRGTGYVDDSAVAASKQFTGLTEARTYNISVKALGDTNHFESAPVALPAVYTKYTTPVVTDIIYVDYASETLKFKDGITPGNYTVKVTDSAGATIENGQSITSLANAGNFSLVVSRNGTGNYPDSDYSTALPVTGKAAAPVPSTTKASSSAAVDGTITLSGNFVYRIHQTDGNETTNWIAANGSVSVKAGTYDVRRPGTAVAFGSNIASALVEVKANQALVITAPGTLTYGTDATKQLAVTGDTGTGTLTFTKAENDDVATLTTGGYITIKKAGSITVTASKLGDANSNPGTSAPVTVTISPRDINNAQVTLTNLNASYPYTGSAINPSPITAADSGATITANDYDVSYGTPPPKNVTVVAGGEVILTGKNNYTGSQTFTFDITKKDQTTPVTVDDTGTVTYGDTAVTLTATGGDSTGAYAYQLAANAEGNAATLSGDQLTITKAGTINVQARLLGDNNYNNSAWSVVKTITVSKKELNVDVTVNNKAYDGTATATASALLHAADIVGSDASALTLGGSVTYAFNDETINTGKTVTRTGEYTLSGGKEPNYTLVQPATTFTGKAITAGFAPVKDTHYTITTNDWTNANFVVTAVTGYAVSKTATATGTGDNAWTNSITWSDENDDGKAQFYVKRTGGAEGGIAQNEISIQKNYEAYLIDKTPPDGAEVQYRGLGWKGFLNLVSFGRFFKPSTGNTVNVEIRGTDTTGTAKSGAATGTGAVLYYVTNTAFTTEQAQAIVAGGSVTWIDQAATPLFLTYGSKYHIFAKVKDNAGNTAVFYDSAVIFKDSAAGTTDVSYTRKENADKTVNVDLNGNSIKAVRQTSPGTADLLLGTDYTVSGDVITLKASYLEGLSVTGGTSSGPTYSFAVDYYPLGETGTVHAADGTYSNTAEPTAFMVTVGKATQAALTVVVPNPVYYGNTGLTLSKNGGSGGGALTYSMTGGDSSGSSVAADGTITVGNVGTIIVKVAKAGDADYLPAESVTATINVQPAVITSFGAINQYVAGKAWPVDQSEGAPNPTPEFAATVATNIYNYAGDYYKTVTANYADDSITLAVSGWANTAGSYTHVSPGSYDFEGTIVTASGPIATGNFSLSPLLKPVVQVVVNDLKHGIKLDTNTHTFASKPYKVAADSKTVTITNIGTESTGKLKAVLTGGSSKFVLSAGADNIAALAATNNTTTFTVTPKSSPALDAGTYTDTLTVSYYDNAESYLEPVVSRTIELSYTVTPAEITSFATITDKAGGSLPSPTYSDVAAVKAALAANPINPITANYDGGTVSVTTIANDWTNTGTTYNAAVSGTYTFECAPSSIPANYANSGAYKATVNVVILPANAAAPDISTQPQAGTYFTDQSPATALSVATSGGNGTMTYQWYSNTTNSNSGGTTIGGATNATYTPPITAAGNTYYYVVITASVPGAAAGHQTDTVTSATALVSVTVRDRPVLTSGGDASRTSATTATIDFSTTQPGTAYYLEAASNPGAAAIVLANDSLGSVSGTETGKTVMLSGEGVKHIYVVVVGTTTDTDKNSNVIDITAPKFDNDPPTISGVVVTDSGTGKAITGTIIITFNEAMDMAAGAVTITGGTGNVGAGSWTSDKTYEVAYGDGTPLEYYKEYTLVFTGFKDAADNALSQTPGEKKFTTERPPNPIAPDINIHPAGADYASTEISPAALTVAASNGANPGTLSYKWYYNTTDSILTTTATQVGGNSPSHVPEITAVASTRYYFVEVTNTVANASSPTAITTSGTAKVTVTIPQYTVKFDIGSGVGTTPVDILRDIGTNVALPDGTGFSRTDYTFGGWSLTPNPLPSDTDYPLGAMYTSATNSVVTLYAVWVENVALIFNSKGGSSVDPVHIDPLDVTYGDVAGWPAQKPTRAGYDFAGWYIEEVDGAAAVAPTLVKADDDIAATVSTATGGGVANDSITLHAHWTKLNTKAFGALLAEIEKAFGTDAANIHDENYPDGKGAAFRTAVKDAKAAVAAAVTQGEVDAALASLEKAYKALVQEHRLLKHSHDAKFGGKNHLTKYGETVTVEIKGYFDDIIRPSGFRLNGGGNYTLKKGKAADTLIITEKGVGEIGRITKGSAVVTLPASLTDRLENGTHTIEILFEEGTKSGSGTAKVVVKRSVTEKKPDPGPGQPGQPGQPAGPPISAPDTADDMNLTLWFVLMAAALAALIAAAAMRRRLMKRPQ